MKLKITYAELLDKIMPSLDGISTLEYPEETPISHHIEIAQNLDEIESAAKTFWSAREKIMSSLCEKGENGKPRVKIDKKSGQNEAIIADKNKIIWNKKIQALREEEVSITLHELNKATLEGVNGVTPKMIQGLLKLLI